MVCCGLNAFHVLFCVSFLSSFSQAYVLSSHRVYVSKADTFELSDTICGKGEAVTIFLFNDSLEVSFKTSSGVYRSKKLILGNNRRFPKFPKSFRYFLTSAYQSKIARVLQEFSGNPIRYRHKLTTCCLATVFLRTAGQPVLGDERYNCVTCR